MHLIREISLELKDFNFYDNNCLYIINCDNKEDLKKISELIFAPNKSKFVKSYVELNKYATSGQSTTICKSICQVIKNIGTNMFNYDVIEDSIDHRSYLTLTLYCCLLDENGYLHLGYKKVKNDLSEFIAKAVNQNVKESEVVKHLNKLMSKYSECNVESRQVVNVLGTLRPLLTMYMAGIQYYTMLDDSELLTEYLEMFVVSTDVENMVGHCYNYFNTCIYRMDEYVNSAVIPIGLKGAEINRVGYLTKEASKGEFSGNMIKNKNNEIIFNTPEKIKYRIREVITEDGIIIVYHMLFSTFLVVVVEDYISGEIYMHQHFVDGAGMENTEENMQLMYKIIYTCVREYYITRLLTHERNLTDKVEVYSEPTVDDKTSNYIIKKIMVAPYKRRLKKGAKRSSDRCKEASKFNIILGDDETFVNSFLRNQRYKEDNLTDTDLANLEDNVKIMPKPLTFGKM